MAVEITKHRLAAMIILSFNEGYLDAKGNYNGVKGAWLKSESKKMYDKLLREEES